MDATHADINVSGSMFKTVYVRVIDRVYEWNESNVTRERLKEAADKLDARVLQITGNPTKMKLQLEQIWSVLCASFILALERQLFDF